MVFIVESFPVNTHSFRWQDLGFLQCVTSVCSDIFSWFPITLSLFPTSVIQSVPNGFWVTPAWYCSHDFPLYWKHPHPPFCLGQSSPLNLKAQFKLPSWTFLCPSWARSISQSCGSESWLSTLIWQLPRIQGNLFVFSVCLFSSGPHLMFFEGKGHRLLFLFPYMVTFS